MEGYRHIWVWILALWLLRPVRAGVSDSNSQSLNEVASPLGQLMSWIQSRMTEYWVLLVSAEEMVALFGYYWFFRLS